MLKIYQDLILRSRTEEEYAEKEQLLQEVTDMVREFAGNKKRKLMNADAHDRRARVVGIEIRNAATNFMEINNATAMEPDYHSSSSSAEIVSQCHGDEESMPMQRSSQFTAPKTKDKIKD